MSSAKKTGAEQANGSAQPHDAAAGAAANGDAKEASASQPPEGKPPGGKMTRKERKEELQKNPPGGFDDTPVPRAPPGYTVRITFHRAEKLPMADLTTLSSDPYLTAELTTNLATRHKEDPVLRFRTHTIWKNLAPKWEEEWILHHIPADGFKLKLRIYDEDSRDHDDRLGNVHVDVDRIDEKWQGIREQPFKIKKKMGSKRAYFVRALAVCTGRVHEMSGRMYVSVECLGRSPGNDGGRAYTFGKNYWCKHYSPLLGRMVNSKEPDSDEYHSKIDQEQQSRTGTHPSTYSRKADNINNRLETLDQSERARVANDYQTEESAEQGNTKAEIALQKLVNKNDKKKSAQRYNFQANQFQLQGPVPPELYHRYVEFRPFMKSMFTAKGVRGFILSKALHHQHVSVYNFNRETRYGVFDGPCPDMTLKFLELAHFDEGSRIFTYVITLDGLFRFTETGKEFGIDLLSKHTMHSDRSIYIAFSGEFFIRRLKHPHHESPDEEKGGHSRHERERLADNETHPPHSVEGGPPAEDPPKDAAYYELIIDNDSGTYRPNAKMLPKLKHFLETNFPGLKIVTLDCQEDEKLMNKLKTEQRERKKKEQGNVVYQQISRSSSVSSDDESRLDALAQKADKQYADEQQAEGGPSKAGAQEGQDDADGTPAMKQKHKLGEALAPFAGNHEHMRAALGEKAQ